MLYFKSAIWRLPKMEDLMKRRINYFVIYVVIAALIAACGDDSSSNISESSSGEVFYNTNFKYGTLIDARDGQSYRTIPIGSQVWMAENLNYASESSWCYNDDPKTCESFGRLYNWNSALSACPEGWHLPSRAEWWTLVVNVGGRFIAGMALKSTSVWVTGYGRDGIDSYGFSILPNGYKDSSQQYRYGNRSAATFWSTSGKSSNDTDAYGFYIGYNYGPSIDDANKDEALSVRCLQDMPDAEPVEGTLTDSRDGQTYRTVVIGTQTWMAENLNYASESSVCFLIETENCDKYGRLYKWVDAVNACPAGWHLPDTTEWQKLFFAVDAGPESAGIELKSVSGWSNDFNYESDGDLYGFSALPAGAGILGDGVVQYSNDGNDSSAVLPSNVTFYFIDDNVGAFFWSATEALGNNAFSMHLMTRMLGAYLNANYDKQSLFSVRCVRD